MDVEIYYRSMAGLSTRFVEMESLLTNLCRTIDILQGQVTVQSLRSLPLEIKLQVIELGFSINFFEMTDNFISFLYMHIFSNIY